jgi:hypothetical protein
VMAGFDKEFMCAVEGGGTHTVMAFNGERAAEAAVRLDDKGKATDRHCDRAVPVNVVVSDGATGNPVRYAVVGTRVPVYLATRVR